MFRLGTLRDIEPFLITSSYVFEPFCVVSSHFMPFCGNKDTIFLEEWVKKMEISENFFKIPENWKIERKIWKISEIIIHQNFIYFFSFQKRLSINKRNFFRLKKWLLERNQREAWKNEWNCLEQILFQAKIPKKWIKISFQKKL